MKPAKQNEVPLPGAFVYILNTVDPGDPTDEPDAFVRGLTRIWKRRGGDFQGKPRHSDRYLGELLKSQGTPVRSLTAKLKLKNATRLQAEDAGALVRLVLSYWEYHGAANDVPTGKADQYKPFFDEKLIDEAANYIRKRISDAEEEEANSTSGSRKLPGNDTARLIRTEFEKSDALFTVSSGQTLIVPKDPKLALKGFRDLITELWLVEMNEKKGRFLAWILDATIWGWEEKDWASRLRFMNVHALITRFKALKEFPDRHADANERWSWLQSNSVIIIYGIRPRIAEGPKSHIEPELLQLQHQYVLINQVPDEWDKSTRFLALYGSQKERKDQASYSIFVNKATEDESSQSSSALDQELEFRYFAQAQLAAEDNESEPAQPRSLELPDPGWSYELAYKFVYAAAMHFLSSRKASKQHTKFGAAAVDGLHQLGFSLLSPDEFIKL
jgi:hypothetical protein